MPVSAVQLAAMARIGLIVLISIMPVVSCSPQISHEDRMLRLAARRDSLEALQVVREAKERARVQAKQDSVAAYVDSMMAVRNAQAAEIEAKLRLQRIENDKQREEDAKRLRELCPALKIGISEFCLQALLKGEIELTDTYSAENYVSRTYWTYNRTTCYTCVNGKLESIFETTR